MSVRTLFALALLVALGCKEKGGSSAGTESAVALPDGPELSSVSSRDYRSIAEKVVSQSAGVKEGDIVMIVGSNEDLPLVEDIAVEVRKRGASPLVTVGTERLDRRMYDEVPAQYDSQTPEVNLKLAGIIDVIISTESGEGRTLKGVAPERMAARMKAGTPIGELMRKRGVRGVFLGNGLYPSAERAEQLGISRDELGDMLYGGVDADYAALQATGEKVRSALASGKELRITNPNGTDLRVGIAGRPITVSDGIISAEDRKKGGAAVSVWLPAGEVFLIPVAGTANGIVVTDQDYFQGDRIDGLRMEFKNGKMTSMSAKSGIEGLQAAYDAAGSGKDVLGVIDIGINLGVKAPEERPLRIWSQAGTVSVVVGNNTWAGGDNQVNFSATGSAPNSTVTVDGKTLVQDGTLVAGENVANR
jgi:leucyl aminopeptidase (aminopeptidase T)